MTVCHVTPLSLYTYLLTHHRLGISSYFEFGFEKRDIYQQPDMVRALIETRKTAKKVVEN